MTDTVKGEKVTSWYNVNVWGDLIDWKHRELTKGALCLVNGRMAIQSWAKDGVTHQKVVITADAYNGITVFGRKDDEGVVSRPRGAATGNQVDLSHFTPVDDDVPF